MDLGLKDKVVLVTGASAGIGRAVAEAFAREGCRVAVSARRQDALDELAGQLRSLGAADALAVAGDVESTDDIAVVHAAVLSRFDALHVLVNNAGGPPEGAFLECDDAMWEEGFRRNILSAVRFTRLALDPMRRQRWGRVVNVSSVAARQPIDRLTISNALRPGLAGLVRTLANEHGAENITFNNVLPGFTATARVEELASALATARGASMDEVKEGWRASIPAGRLAEPAEIARAIVFLASDAGGYVNGVSLPVDGGWLRGAN
jgi:3-oxoacyl-[acyl-carrier protein] reductase